MVREFWGDNLHVEESAKQKIYIAQLQKLMSSKQKVKSTKQIDSEKDSGGWKMYRGDTELGQKVNEILNGGIYAIFSTLIMLYSLFSDDIRQICFDQGADLTFSVLTLICMIYYGFEIVVFSLFQKDYFLKYYFWLDLLSTLTMAFDLIWVTQYITGGGKNAANISQITKASRAARLGTRTVRLIRLVRMIKIMKQMKTFSKDLVKNQADQLPKRVSQRLSSIHSKLTSQRNLERLSSLRHLQKLPSKRWSLIKDTNCMNVQNPIKPDILSINCLPFKEHDEIIDRDSVSRKSDAVSVKSQKKITSFKKVESVNGDNKLAMLDRIEEEPKEEAKERAEQMSRSKRSRFEITVKKINDPNSDNEIVMPQQTKVGSRVQDEIQKNIILMIILILISIPLLDASTWISPLAVYDRSMDEMVYIAETLPAKYQSQVNSYIEYSIHNFQNALVYFSINTTHVVDSFPDNYNNYAGTINEILTYTRAEDLSIIESSSYTVAYDISNYNSYVSYMNIGRTLFVCILLIFTTMLFSNDLEFAAIAPLEEMFDTVRKIAINPLNALREIEEKNMCMEAIQEEPDELQDTEPKILKNTIVKIGSLLAVGFGEAGTEIISRVIEDPSIINVMIPGKKIMAIFGFCDIRNFTDATEVLEADVMVFVNEIAEICHRVTHEHLGSPNKNIGDAFLLVWKFAQSDCQITQTEQQMQISLNPSNKVKQLADLSVLSLIKMIADITKSQALQKYKHNKKLQERIPNYAGVKMGFGLHVGWAIEGPIGSEYKIDASYLSSHVHMASRLEAATKAYGASMLITGSLYDLMTPNRSNLRHIDRVIPTGETELMDLYTIDIIPKHLFEEVGIKSDKKRSDKEKRMDKVCQNLNRKKLQEDITKQHTTDLLWNDEDIRIMMEPYQQAFYDEWRKGFRNYLDGNWEQALAQLNVARSYAPGGSDGPSESLISFIELNNGKAPENWEGHREFD